MIDEKLSVSDFCWKEIKNYQLKIEKFLISAYIKK